ncbi:hypothetical protein PILCRDRAFT_196612 [Piloderma croceum F 1598]|uniref:Uncharacterized protein n=1 Tax=Piloderma croceum (strain F 1598) TaxID=765440 RepID=A0A0C3GDM6_PILCF|nr:hypothetical protein PILCRDRAFT_196612 [Piloderma croceum F 1598]
MPPNSKPWKEFFKQLDNNQREIGARDKIVDSLQPSYLSYEQLRTSDYFVFCQHPPSSHRLKKPTLGVSDLVLLD